MGTWCVAVCQKPKPYLFWKHHGFTHTCLNLVENVTTSPVWSVRLQIENNVTEMLAKDSECNHTGSHQGETLNKREENPSQQVEADNPNIDPIVESNLTSIRGSDK